MPDPMPRWLVALAVIVAVVAISFGVRDYVSRQKEAKAPATASTPTVAHSKSTAPRKKTASAKTRARMAPTQASVPVAAQTAADDARKALNSEEFARAGASATGLTDNASSPIRTLAAHDELAAAMDGSNLGRNELDSMTACMPLPNGTKPVDVDANYYRDWAKEYSCLLIP